MLQGKKLQQTDSSKANSRLSPDENNTMTKQIMENDTIAGGEKFDQIQINSN